MELRNFHDRLRLSILSPGFVAIQWVCCRTFLEKMGRLYLPANPIIFWHLADNLNFWYRISIAFFDPYGRLSRKYLLYFTFSDRRLALQVARADEIDSRRQLPPFIIALVSKN